MEIDMESFAYSRSMTLPPYNEGVRWLVARNAQFADNKQLNKLFSCWNHESNARESQESFGINVYYRSSCML